MDIKYITLKGTTAPIVRTVIHVIISVMDGRLAFYRITIVNDKTRSTEIWRAIHNYANIPIAGLWVRAENDENI